MKPELMVDITDSQGFTVIQKSTEVQLAEENDNDGFDRILYNECKKRIKPIVLRTEGNSYHVISIIGEEKSARKLVQIIDGYRGLKENESWIKLIYLRCIVIDIPCEQIPHDILDRITELGKNRFANMYSHDFGYIRPVDKNVDGEYFAVECMSKAIKCHGFRVHINALTNVDLKLANSIRCMHVHDYRTQINLLDCGAEVGISGRFHGVITFAPCCGLLFQETAFIHTLTLFDCYFRMGYNERAIQFDGVFGLMNDCELRADTTMCDMGVYMTNVKLSSSLLESRVRGTDKLYVTMKDSEFLDSKVHIDGEVTIETRPGDIGGYMLEFNNTLKISGSNITLMTKFDKNEVYKLTNINVNINDVGKPVKWCDAYGEIIELDISKKEVEKKDEPAPIAEEVKKPSLFRSLIERLRS